MDRKQLIEAQMEAATVLDAGQRLAASAAKRQITGRDRGRVCAEALGSALATPSEFWAVACMVEAGSEVTGVAALSLGIRLAAANMAAENLGFVRESLIGQAQWASVLAVKLAAQAEGEGKIDKQAQLIKLALAAQRQAAAALATAAALNKLQGADAVTMGD